MFPALDALSPLDLTCSRRATAYMTNELMAHTCTHAVTPICKEAQKTTYGVGRNEVTQVTCDVDSDPRNVTFKWFFDDFDLRTEIKSFTTNGTRSIASFSPSASSSKAVTVSGTTSSMLMTSSTIGVDADRIAPALASFGPASPASSSASSSSSSASSLAPVAASLTQEPPRRPLPTRHSMYGKLICVAENAIGRQRDPCVFSIIPSSESMFAS